MKFIRGRIQRHKSHCGARLRPAPRARIGFGGLPDRAPEKECQDRILGEVRAFPGEGNDVIDVGLRHVRKEPVQDRADDAGRMLVRLRVARRGKNDRHPDQDRQPIFVKRTGAKHGQEKTEFFAATQT